MESQRVGHDWATFTFYCIGIRNKLMRKIFWERGSSQLPAPAPFMLYYFTAPLMSISHVEHWHKHMHVCSVVSNSLWPHGLQPARLLCPWNFPGKNIGVGCHALFQGIFLTQGLNPCLLHCRWIFTAEPPEKPHSNKYLHLKFIFHNRDRPLPTLLYPNIYNQNLGFYLSY